MTESSGNTFGLGCKKICGDYRNEEQCHRVNGSCPNGCNKGTTDVNCDIGMHHQNIFSTLCASFKTKIRECYIVLTKQRSTVITSFVKLELCCALFYLLIVHPELIVKQDLIYS